VDEGLFAQGKESAKELVRALSSPDARVQLAAATVIDRARRELRTVIEHLARQIEPHPPDEPSRERSE
jgi:hypothetical protein